MNLFYALLDTVDTVVVANGGSSAAAASGEGAQAASGGLFSNPIIMIIFYFVLIFGAMYFFSIRPQKKREKSMQEMREAIKPGDPVLLTNGLFGKVIDVTAECYIVEFGTNKGIRIPVLKHEVYAKKEPNLTNKTEEVVEEPKPKLSLFGGKKDSTTDALSAENENNDKKDNNPLA